MRLMEGDDLIWAHRPSTLGLKLVENVDKTGSIKQSQSQYTIACAAENKHVRLKLYDSDEQYKHFRFIMLHMATYFKS